MITLITPTGDRPIAFELCERWIRRQTYEGPLQWIVVDDGKVQTETTLNQDYVRRKPVAGEPQPTLATNLLHAIPLVRGNRILIIEDDDWYSEKYVEVMLQFLADYGLVGEGEARYYHLPSRRWQQLDNMRHASLCQTGFHAELLPMFRRACLDWAPGTFAGIDMSLWAYASPQTSARVLRSIGLSTGMKGLPGRSGCGSGHRMAEREAGQIDRDGSVLKSWVGAEDAETYFALLDDEREGSASE